MNVRIAVLADHPEAIPALAKTYEQEWPEWYGIRGDALVDLRARARKSGLPLGLVALERDDVVGALAIADHAPQRFEQFRPWIIGLLVQHTHRRMGIGRALLAAALDHARAMGYGQLYASTAHAGEFFERSGWSPIGVSISEGGDPVTVFATALR